MPRPSRRRRSARGRPQLASPRAPRTGAAVPVAASKAVRFRAAKAAKEAVNAAAPGPRGARARPASKAAA